MIKQNITKPQYRLFCNQRPPQRCLRASAKFQFCRELNFPFLNGENKSILLFQFLQYFYFIPFCLCPGQV